MPFKKHFSCILSALIIFSITSLAKPAAKHDEPYLTVVIVIDQLAHHYLDKLSKNFTGGLKKLLKQGVVFQNAFHPHGIPETTPGHHAISTGTLPRDHGAVLNQWLNDRCYKIPFESDTSGHARVFSKDGFYNTGKSCHHTAVDGFSDQFLLSEKPDKKAKVFALSLKSYPALSMANRLGKAIWFDEKAGGFTSSERYFTQLPSWLTAFNKHHKIEQLTTVTWKSVHHASHKAYRFPFTRHYQFAGLPFSFIDKKEVQLDKTTATPYDLYLKTPASGKLLLECAQECIRKNFDRHSRMLLWVSLSNLDLAGHVYGPDSMEIIDTIYHVDRQLNVFIKFLEKTVGKKNFMLVLTADHGIAPLPEIMAQKGYPHARRIIAKNLIRTMNVELEKTYNIPNIVSCFEPTSFVLNHTVFQAQDQATQLQILNDIKKILKSEPGIKEAWTFNELQALVCQPDSYEQFYKNQLFANRTGDIIIQPHPFCQVTNYETGTSHQSPYDYDTHVPLIFYHHKHLKPGIIKQKVWIPQLPVTLAHLLRISKPGSSPYGILPGI